MERKFEKGDFAEVVNRFGYAVPMSALGQKPRSQQRADMISKAVEDGRSYFPRRAMSGSPF
jgi:hypothetical protein